MLGAIIGDIVGSAYEFHPTNKYDFEMFRAGSSYTDDSICTIAIADAILKHKDYGESLHEWCQRYMYPMGGYGGRFKEWVMSSHPQPYNSFGNGSAMRVSPVAWAFKNAFAAVPVAERTAACTHNHPEGIKGAQAVALAIHIGDEIRRLSEKIDKETIIKGFERILEFSGYDINIQRSDVLNKFDETCQGTVPVALWIITESNSFEDAIRKAISLGADADTLGAIVGSIAEAIWGIPTHLAVKAMSYLSEEMKDVVLEFYQRYEVGDGSLYQHLVYAREMERRKKAENAEYWRQVRARLDEAKRQKELRRIEIIGNAKCYMTCIVAGTKFIHPQSIYYSFGVNDILTMKSELNKHDENAIALYFGEEKIGYIPRKQNAELSKLLKKGYGGSFLVYVSDWDGCDEKRKITIKIMRKKNAEADPFAYNEVVYGAYRTVEKDQLYYSTGGSTGTLQGRTTPARIDELGPNEIFVFGSNAQGYHGGGAAHAAMKKFGAEWGKGDGLQGRSYAISTMEGLLNTARNINRFIEFASKRQDLRFLVTPIGCGIAGYTPLQIAPLFRKAITLPNVFLPRIFWEYFWITEGHQPDYFTPDEGWKKWNK